MAMEPQKIIAKRAWGKVRFGKQQLKGTGSEKREEVTDKRFAESRRFKKKKEGA